MISFFDCYCDKSNAGNDGCSKKTLLFAEAVTKAVSQKANTVGENPAEVLLKVRGHCDWQGTRKYFTQLYSFCKCSYPRHNRL